MRALPEEAAAYDAPYPSMIYKAAVRTFPSMIAAIEDQNASAWKTLGKFRKPFLFLGGKRDLSGQGSEDNQKRLTKQLLCRLEINNGELIQSNSRLALLYTSRSFQVKNPYNALPTKTWCFPKAMNSERICFFE